MRSTDVQFLFTSIPLNERINNCVSDLHSKNLYNEEFSKRDLLKLLGTATSKYYFIFDYLLYKKVEGIAMSFLLGPALANLFSYHYEKEWLDNCPVHFRPKAHFQFFVDYRKKQHKCLKFTSAAENDNSFSFLDIKITLNN